MSANDHSHRRRVGLNAHLLNLSGNYRSAGISWYIYHLLQNLPASQFEFTVFTSEGRARRDFRQLHYAFSRLPTRQPIVRIVWEQVVQPLALLRERIDLLHALAFAGPLSISIPWVVTVYDLSFIRYPDSFNRANRTYLKWATGSAVRRANRVIAISESTKRDLVNHYRIPPERITVVYCGRDCAPSQPDHSAVESWRIRRGLPDHFILHVGTLEPRKNIPRLVRAFARARRSAHLPLHLVLVGAKGWKYDEVDRVIAQEQVEDCVVFAGYVPQAELPLWYRAAEAFVYPSLYEGFGLPPLEAMAAGLPVVCSNASSLPEVVGDAALVVPPEDETALADSIVRIASDSALREELVTRGKQQAGKFSWERTAHETALVYEAVFAERRLGTAHAAA